MADDFIEQLRDEEERYLPDPPEGLWDDIARNLPPVQRPRRVIPLWVRYGGAAACVAVLLGVGVLLLHAPGVELPADKPQAQVRPTSSAAETVTPQPEAAAEATVPLLAQAVPPVRQTPSAAAVAVDPAPQPSVAADTASSAPAVTPKPEQPHHRPDRGDRSDRLLASDVTRPKSRRAPALSLYAGNIMASNSSSQTSYVMSSSPDTETGDSPYSDICDLNTGLDVDTKKHYSLPLRAGVRLSLPLTDALSLESGVTYTLLSSSLESGSNENYYRTEQKLHYVGVPLKLRCKVWSGKRVSLYASGGGMVEKCVAGRASTRFILSGVETGKEEQTVSEKPLQLSASLAAGVEASVASRVQLFVEPGASYYFDNHSSVDNVYKDRPLNFDLNIGLRINLNE